MAGIVAIIVKVMPESPESDLGQIKIQGEKVLVKLGAKNVSVEEKPVAFGLRALFFKFAWPEEQDSSIYEDALAKVKDVSSVQTEDYRRAFG